MKSILFSVTALLSSTFAFSIVHLEKRIVNGDLATKAVPWLVSMQDAEGSHFCGGSLIQRDIVLTGTSTL
jgi:secreted trypsin-like serine protease